MKKRKQRVNLLALSLALGLFMYSAAMGAPSTLATRAGDMLASASVGASASVAPNPYNTLAAQLDAKQAALAQEEADLAARKTSPTGAQGDFLADLPLYSFLMSLILTVLVGVNFYFDWKRRQPANSVFARPIIDLNRRG